MIVNLAGKDRIEVSVHRRNLQADPVVEPSGQHDRSQVIEAIRKFESIGVGVDPKVSLNADAERHTVGFGLPDDYIFRAEVVQFLWRGPADPDRPAVGDAVIESEPNRGTEIETEQILEGSLIDQPEIVHDGDIQVARR